MEYQTVSCRGETDGNDCIANKLLELRRGTSAIGSRRQPMNDVPASSRGLR